MTRILRDRVRIALHHRALRLGADRVAAELAPRDEELLVRREAVDRRRGGLPCCDLLERAVGDLGAGEIADASPSTSLPLWWMPGSMK